MISNVPVVSPSHRLTVEAENVTSGSGLIVRTNVSNTGTGQDETVGVVIPAVTVSDLNSYTPAESNPPTLAVNVNDEFPLPVNGSGEILLEVSSV